ncbi:MAG TPA: outer membrane beta-barrel protein [Saprospiraceae bacterium]|nr:outer membrane beta-barrel protein [Saprospiraceae bacterium]HNG89696.1 outer membrane beta-barrel protein [Saprospiraceae bacterium]
MSRIVFTLFAYLCFSALASAQSRITILKAGPSLLSNFYGEGDGGDTYFGGALAMEREIGAHFSFSFGGQYHTAEEASISPLGSATARTNYLMIDPEIRWYPKSATQGFYLGLAPTLNIQKYKVTGVFPNLPAPVTAIDKSTQLGASLRVGYQFDLNSHLRAQFGTGFGIIFPGEDYDGLIQIPLNVMLGYQF